MDKISQTLLTEAEASAESAEQQTEVDSGSDLATAISHSYTLARLITQLNERRTAKNRSAQKVVHKHSSWFKPMIDRLEKQRDYLRGRILEHLAPGGKLGNRTVDEVREWGVDGTGSASLAETIDYDVDLAVLLEHHPELLTADMTAIRKAAKSGELPKGVTAKKSYQLRIT